MLRCRQFYYPSLLLVLAGSLLANVWSFVRTAPQAIAASATGLKPRVGIEEVSRRGRQIAKHAAASVVEIRTVRTVGGRLRRRGCGVAIRDGRLVITNAHVVKNAIKLGVATNDRLLKARLVAVSVERDLALLRLDEGRLTPMKLIDSDTVEAGSLVWAIGSPFGFEHSVSFGVLSSHRRKCVFEGRPMALLQTDAMLKPGNSGGALVDQSGSLIGVTTAVAGNGFDEMGFAVSSHHVRQFVDRQLKHQDRQADESATGSRPLIPEVASAVASAEAHSPAPMPSFRLVLQRCLVGGQQVQ